jgi:hypothetical protein
MSRFSICIDASPLVLPARLKSHHFVESAERQLGVYNGLSYFVILAENQPSVELKVTFRPAGLQTPLTTLFNLKIGLIKNN